MRKRNIHKFFQHYDEETFNDGTSETADKISRDFFSIEEIMKHAKSLPDGHQLHGDISIDRLAQRRVFSNDEGWLENNAASVASMPYEKRLESILTMKRKLALYYDLLPIIRRHHIELLHDYCREVHGNPCIETSRLYDAYDELPFRQGL